MFYLRSYSLVAILGISCHLARDKLTGRKPMKMRGEENEDLQNGAWDNDRFDRE